MRIRRALGLAVALLPLAGAAGCIGAVVGTIVDTAQHTISRPVQEYVFRGVYKYDNDPDAPWRTLEDDRGRDYGRELVGVAVSGGGSRAAYFLACVLEAMRHIDVPARERGDAAPEDVDAVRQGLAAAPHSLLDEVDYVSSVSGGSLAAAYYVLHRPATSDPGALDAFFDRYRADMRRHFELASVARLLFLFRWVPVVFTYYHRGHVMASTWDADFFGKATFTDLPPPRPPHPSLIVNATSYSTGQKFVFTRLPVARFNDSRLFAGIRQGRLIRQGYDQAHRPLSNDSFETIDSDIGSFQLSQAVVASAGVPNLLGPVVLKNRASTVPAYEALGDGGIYDNHGLETLVQLFATILEERPGLRARIIVVDGSGYFATDRLRYEYTVAGYADRTTTIGWLRAADYAEPVFQLFPLVLEGRATTGDTSPYRNLRFQVVSLYHEDATEGGAEAEQRRGLARVVRGAADMVTGVVNETVGVGVDRFIDFVKELNQNAKGIGTRFKLSRGDVRTIETRAAIAVPLVLGNDGSGPLGPPRVPVAAGKP